MRVLLAFLRDKYLDILFLYVALQLIVVGASGWLRRWQLVVIGAIILAGVAAWLLFVERRRSKRVPDLGKEEAFQRQRQAVIFTLGLNPYERSPCPLVLSNLKVRIVGFVATEQVMTDHYATYRTALETMGLVVEPTTCINEDVADIATKTEALLKKILDNYNLEAADVVVDVTGGTKLMSLGAFSGAVTHQVDCQVMASKFDKVGKRIDGAIRPILVVSYTQSAI